MEFITSHERRVAFADTDMAGFAHFTAILRWVEEAEAGWRRSRGESLATVDASGVVIGWPKVALSVQYKSPVRFDDVVNVRLAEPVAGKTSLTWFFEVTTGAAPGERLVASGEMRVVHAAISPTGVLRVLPH